MPRSKPARYQRSDRTGEEILAVCPRRYHMSAVKGRRRFLHCLSQGAQLCLVQSLRDISDQIGQMRRFWPSAQGVITCPLSKAVVGSCTASHKERSYASFKACAISAIRSDGCSMPIDSRMVESRTPIFWRMSAGTPEWVMLAGRLASDSVPPRLTASLKICSAFKNLKAAPWPPTMSNENVEPAPVHCLANRRPAGEASSW